MNFSDKKSMLYIDVPFDKDVGGDKNRSRFLYESLRAEYDVERLLITSEEQSDEKTHTISTCAARFPGSDAVYSFPRGQIGKFKRVLTDGKYDIVFVRFCSPARLAEIAERVLPYAKIVIDVDMLFSRIASLSWSAEKSFKNRFYLFEKYKLARFERGFFRKPYLFLFSNPGEKDYVLNKYAKSKCKGSLAVLPNVMKDAQADSGGAEEPYILFFGTLNSAANEDAFGFLAHEIYPHVSQTLEKKGVSIYVAGKNQTALYSRLCQDCNLSHVRLIGQVENIEKLIAQSLFILLPLRIGSGTRTRILEAAALKKAVITTSIGVEGLEFCDGETARADTTIELAEHIKELLADPQKSERIGRRLYASSKALYDADTISKRLIERIEGYEPRRMKVAIVTNRFYPEVGGAETNIYFQARRLAEDFDVTVFCPRRINKAKRETIDGFETSRLYDVFNPAGRFPNIKSKTLTPAILWKILFGSYDLVMCFPALNCNNMLAFIAGKISGKKIILCCFDWLDYASIMKTRGALDPNILADHVPKKRQKFFLRRFDHIFGISNKEIEFFKQYNSNTSYSPVPVLIDEYDAEAADPREKYGIGKDDFIFLALGRVSKIKGQDIVLEAFERVLADLDGAKLVFVGRTDYEPELFESMRQFVDERGLGERVVFTGKVERDEVLGWLRHCDIHVIAVRFMNSGAVVVESWASGTPVIQSDAVDPNLVQDGRNGLLFKSGSAESLSQAMRKAWADRTALPKMGKSGAKLVQEKYTYEYLIGLYRQTYKNVL